MCGIVGCVSRFGSFDPEVFLSMRETLAHRGPDDARAWSSSDGRVLLGHRRLAILDLSNRARQPMRDLAGNLTITFNGEIYNFIELRQELGSRFPFRSESDTEVLLAAYQVWGTDCLRHLNGMFAFAIWDQRTESLFAARDRFGEKPFYYFHDRDTFLFASEIKALLASRLIDAKANSSAIYRYLAYRETDATEGTLFEGVASLLPATALVYSPARNSVRTWRYWDLDPNLRTNLPTDQHYANHFLELLKDSIKIRMRSDVALGSSLSGGTDSSSIVGLVSEQTNGSKQRTFSARFDDPEVDEGEYIQSVLECFPVEGYSVAPDPSRFVDEMENLAWHQEHPFSSASVYAQWCVMRLAQETGTTVVLDGQGADESLGGYAVSYGPHFIDLLRGGQWQTLLRGVVERARNSGLEGIGVLALSMLPRRIQEQLERVRQASGIRPEFARNWMSPPSHAPSAYRSSLQDELYQQLRCSMLPKLLRFSDRNSMAFSREVRLPFLDHRLVEFLFSIPEEQKIKGSYNKIVLRRAMQGIVPDRILRRTDKKGFETPASRWLAGPLRSWAEGLLFSQEFLNRDWIDATGARRIWRQFLSRRSRNQSLILRWLSLEMWAKLFLKPRTSRERVPSLSGVRPWRIQTTPSLAGRDV